MFPIYVLIVPSPGLSVLWIVPEVLLPPSPYLLFLIILWVHGGGKLLVYWLAIVESVLVYRTLPGLLEEVIVRRIWKVEDMDVLQERAQKGLLEYIQG